MKAGTYQLKGKKWAQGIMRKGTLLGFNSLFSETKWISFQHVGIKMEFFIES